MLKRYWLVIHPESRYGPKNVGITAYSPAQARTFAKEVLQKTVGANIPEALFNEGEIIENIDIRQLDQSHVIPNMGVVSRIGVWFPNCNS